MLADFIMHDAISLEEKDIPELEINAEEKEAKKYLTEVQWGEKIIGKKLLLIEGFKEENIHFERAFRGSRPDILAEQEEKIILVECCSCRVNKIIDFLTEVREVWILTRGNPKWQNPVSKADTMGWFIFTKGPNWSKIYNAIQVKMQEELKKIKSPIDALMKG